MVSFFILSKINIKTNTLKLETYDAVSIAVKSNDKNYIIHEIKGWKKFSNHKILICNKKIVEFNKIKLQLSEIGINYKNIFHFNI